MPDDLAATIQWRDGSPTYEEIEALNVRAAELEEAENELRGIQVELGGIHADATNNDEPFSQKRIQAEKDRVDGLRGQISDIQGQLLKTANDHGNVGLVTPDVAASGNKSIKIPVM